MRAPARIGSAIAPCYYAAMEFSPMPQPSQIITLMSLDQSGAGAADWIHLVPAGIFTAIDGRGPFQCDTSAILASFAGLTNKKLPIDLDHGIDSSPFCGDGRAYGWIIALEARDSGIWGRVEWTNAGKELLADKAYGFISPVIRCLPEGTVEQPLSRVVAIDRAALTNNPALTQLQSFRARSRQMNKELMAALGLSEDGGADKALAAIKALNASQTVHKELLSSLQKLAGLGEAADEKAAIAALTEKLAAAQTASAGKTGLEKTVAELNSQLTALTTAQKQEKAELFVNAALKEGKIVPALKEHYIARHMADAAAVEKEIHALTSINAGGLAGHQPQNAASLSGDDKKIAEMMSVSAEDFAKTKKTQETL
ncbi:MAG: hypothetical protein DU429_07600 [Candidatus Tokpelaia sp.]|nr:MAG: hypothetical protein DU430_08385 [Candidatus Tokpelaia sp.]KAA6205728.1 MAG: hypothetical protein DU429_07600 [Candidatus Tokpelaia sp.]